MTTRADRNRNPAAFTVDMAVQAGLQKGIDFEIGDSFEAGGRTLYTAKLLGDPVEITTRLIDKLGFYTQAGGQRWTYVAFPPFVWRELGPAGKREVIGWMYGREGGTELRSLFA